MISYVLMDLNNYNKKNFDNLYNLISLEIKINISISI